MSVSTADGFSIQGAGQESTASTLGGAAEQVMLVDVGPGFQFLPSTIAAANGSIVLFQSNGSPGNHSITQSSFTQPCVPLSGGLDSGFRQVASGDGVPVWNFTVTDDKTPLWFFCRRLVPVSHCNAGMVFVVNPPSSGIESFNAFQSAAEVATAGTTSQTAPSSADSTVSATSHSIAGSVSASPPATQSGAELGPRGNHVPLAAIIGPIIGSLVLLLCVVAIVVVRRRGSHRKHGSGNTAPRPFFPLSEHGLLDPADEDTLPKPFALYEKNAHAREEQPTGSSSVTNSGSASALPSAAELASANMAMAEEMRFLRGQVQRLESDRRLSGISIGTAPPDYATRASETSSVE
ncbi:hypothetical protein C8R44DRAFT_681267 [Mycena epipterygia]|nr:hypothetical protein C8R44DRAFT_681267 [Mycena epipterygia]